MRESRVPGVRVDEGREARCVDGSPGVEVPHTGSLPALPETGRPPTVQTKARRAASIHSRRAIRDDKGRVRSVRRPRIPHGERRLRAFRRAALGDRVRSGEGLSVEHDLRLHRCEEFCAGGQPGFQNEGMRWHPPSAFEQTNERFWRRSAQ